ncbi:MAG: thiol:disulfide interchange protein DsbA [Pseudohongiellaceae bacterium]|jgi:thiol:disulfide interchange protein DsbA
MISLKRIITAALTAAIFFVSMMALAQSAYEADKHYAVLENPVRTRDANKVEVVEVFWYGCGHCYSFEPIISTWKEGLSDDVDFYGSPAMWGGSMKLHAQAFYAAQALKVLDKVHTPLFVTLNVERKRLNSPESIADLFADYGVEKEMTLKTLKSFGVLSQVRQADARARSFKVSGTPEVVVNGKYRVSGKMAGGQQQMIGVINHLIEKERALLTPKAPVSVTVQ